MTEPDTARRRAINEAALRTLNEGMVEHDVAAGYDAIPLTFVCECFRASCGGQLVMPARRWRELHAAPELYVIVPGHQDVPDVEVVVETTPEYMLVRKVGVAAEVAAEALQQDRRESGLR